MSGIKGHALPDDVAGGLSALGEAIAQGHVSAPLIDTALTALSRLPPAAVSWADGPIADLAHLGWRHAPRLFSLLRILEPNQVEFELLEQHPGLAWVFLFHRNGFVRQRALDTLRAPPTSPFLLAALVLRMNDWVRQVQVAAHYRVEQLLPETSLTVIAGASPFLIDRWRSWGRWDAESMGIIDATLQRPDVAAVMVERFMGKTPGPLATQLRYALKGPSYDPYLLNLAQHAAQPAVRVVAFNALVRSRASWPVGFRREWIDKRYGLSRRVVAFDSRAIQHDYPLPGLTLTALRDRSAAVRRAAADALIEQRSTFPDIDRIVGELSRDRSPAIRERADFLQRKLAEERASGSGRTHD
jgi:hypothetical protein